MFKAAFLVPFLALVALLSVSAPANASPPVPVYAAPNRGVSYSPPMNRSPAASSFSGDTVIKSRSLFGGRKTETRIAADGTSRSVIQTRRLFGGKIVRVSDRSASGQPLYDATTKTTRRGNIKESTAAGEGWSNASKTRFNIFTGNRTTRFSSQSDDGSGQQGKITMHGNKLEKSKQVAWNGDGFKTTTKERRTFIGRLKRDVVTTNPNGEVVEESHEKFRRNGTLMQ